MPDTLRLKMHPILDKRPVSRPTVRIKVNGRTVEAREGESLAAALWANGILTLGHDQKLKAPRGMYCGIGHCFECRVTLDGVHEVRSCITPVREGMRISLPEGVEEKDKNSDR